jgi:microcystin-dependent protein
MAEPFIGEIRIFAGTFAPEGWFYCQGQSLSIAQYQALYAVIGNVYNPSAPQGTFNLPNLQGFAPIGQGTGPGLTPRQLGVPGGKSAVTLTSDTQMAAHTHTVNGTNAQGNSNDPTNRIWAKVKSTPQIQPYNTTTSTLVTMSNNALSPAGSVSPQSHSNMQPYLGINFIIAYEGDFPMRPS